jgi:hypothetical protein
MKPLWLTVALGILRSGQAKYFVNRFDVLLISRTAFQLAHLEFQIRFRFRIRNSKLKLVKKKISSKKIFKNLFLPKFVLGGSFFV